MEPNGVPRTLSKSRTPCGTVPGKHPAFARDKPAFRILLGERSADRSSRTHQLRRTLGPVAVSAVTEKRSAAIKVAD